MDRIDTHIAAADDTYGEGYSAGWQARVAYQGGRVPYPVDASVDVMVRWCRGWTDAADEERYAH
jgi:hypothetical protein